MAPHLYESEPGVLRLVFLEPRISGGHRPTRCTSLNCRTPATLKCDNCDRRYCHRHVVQDGGVRLFWACLLDADAQSLTVKPRASDDPTAFHGQVDVMEQPVSTAAFGAAEPAKRPETDGNPPGNRQAEPGSVAHGPHAEGRGPGDGSRPGTFLGVASGDTGSQSEQEAGTFLGDAAGRAPVSGSRAVTPPK